MGKPKTRWFHWKQWVSLAVIGFAARPAFAASNCSAPSPEAPAQEVERLADAYVTLVLDYDPTLAYASGLPAPTNARLADRRPAALARYHRGQDGILNELLRIDPALLRGSPSESTYAVLKETLESLRDLRICRSELWGVSHLGGWQNELATVAAAQPVGTVRQRADALRRWRSLPQYVEVEITNLRAGLAAGYSVPKPVVSRVIQQVTSLFSSALEDSPYNSPARRAQDPKFASAFRHVVEYQINPALRRYANFLGTEYLPRARTSIGLSTLPDGASCYQAYLRRNTTLQRSPQEVFDLGQATVAASAAEIQRLGQRKFATQDLAEIVRRAMAAPENHFASQEELLAYAKSLVQQAKEKSAALFLRLPDQPIVVQPLPAYQQGSGVQSHYEANPNPYQPATFWIALDNWKTETRAAAAVTVVHEAFPGHHLQVALARSLRPANALGKLVENAAYSEGWANYAERLAEDAGLTDDSLVMIHRRMVLGHSLVIDPAIHAMSWDRDHARRYLMNAGMGLEQADELIDRVVVQPGQLTSYESGGLEILALREDAQQTMGAKFDLREFHQRVLEQGVIPLSALADHVRAWVKSQKQSSNELVRPFN
ncbi:MAG TPA: DUF885 domain-containing protein [Alphaproteobacteria bacterium]|nr:DUF885 domain-containing protein [Alphaproteobacteria bacterium]